MSDQKENLKNFEVICAYCDKPFTVRYPLTRPDAEGEGEVVDDCAFCGKKIKFTIPEKYIGKGEFIRSSPAES